MAMKTSREGLIEIASHEGIVTSPYKDSVGVWTVGIGHTASSGVPDPKVDRREYSVAEIMEIFSRDIARFEARVNRAFNVELKQHEFDAAVSFDFNTGGIHRASWVKNINAGNRKVAQKAILRWRRPPEIIPRRQKERDLFFAGRYHSGGKATVYTASVGGRVEWRKGRSVSVANLISQRSKPPSEQPQRNAVKSPNPGISGACEQRAGWWRVLIRFLSKLIVRKVIQ